MLACVIIIPIHHMDLVKGDIVINNQTSIKEGLMITNNLQEILVEVKKVV